MQGLGVAGGQALGGVIGGVWGPLAPFKLAALLLVMALALIVAHHWLQTRDRARGTDEEKFPPDATPVPSSRTAEPPTSSTCLVHLY